MNGNLVDTLISIKYVIYRIRFFSSCRLKYHKGSIILRCIIQKHNRENVIGNKHAIIVISLVFEINNDQHNRRAVRIAMIRIGLVMYVTNHYSVHFALSLIHPVVVILTILKLFT